MPLYSKVYRKDSASTLDTGSAASNRTSFVTYGITYLQKTNVCNITGTIDTVQIYCATSLTGCKVGTFRDNGDGTYSNRSYATIGSVTSGAVRTYSDLRIDAVAGDLLGIYYTAGALDADATGSGTAYKTGDQFGLWNVGSWSTDANDALSCYATGTAWVRADVTEFRISDTIQNRVSAAEIYVLDPKNTEANYYSAYQQIKIEEGQTGDNNIIFFGRIDEIVPNFSSQYGQTIKLTCRDYLAELTERALNTNFAADTRSEQIKDIFSGYATTTFTQDIEASGSSGTVARDTRNSQTAPLALIEEFASEDPWTNTTWDSAAGAVWRWTPSSWTDNTVEADSSAGTPFAIFSSTASYRYFGRNNPFVGLEFDLQTLGNYGTITWQYWNKAASAWTDLTLTQSYDFTADGSVQWNIPAEWGTRTITNGDPHAGAPPNATSRYWVRANVSAITTDATANSIVIIQGNGYDYYLDYTTDPQTFKYFRRGSLPDYGPRTRGLTLEYAGTDGDQISSYAADYSFMQIPFEIITRVIARGVDSTGTNVSYSVTDTELETSLGLVKEHLEYLYGSVTEADCETRAKSILYNRNKAIIRRGEVTIPFYPKYTYSGTTYLVRAGHLVRVKCSPQSIDEDMLVQEVVYHEPSCMAGLKLMSNAWGRGYGNELTNSIIQLRETNSISTARIGDLIVGSAVIASCSIGALTVGELGAIGTIGAGGGWVTGSSGARVEIDSSGIRCYNSSVQTGNISIDGSGWFGVSGSTISWNAAGALSVSNLIVGTNVQIGTAFPAASAGDLATMDTLSPSYIVSGTLGSSVAVAMSNSATCNIYSGNYVADTSGWKIWGSGDAEFNNVKIRGTLYTSSIYSGNTLTVNGTISAASGKILIDGSGLTVNVSSSTAYVNFINGSYTYGSIFFSGTTGGMYVRSKSNDPSYPNIPLRLYSVGTGKVYIGGGGDAEFEVACTALNIMPKTANNYAIGSGSLYWLSMTAKKFQIYDTNNYLYYDTSETVLVTNRDIMINANAGSNRISCRGTGFYPYGTSMDLGDASNYWDDVHYHTLVAHCDIPSYEKEDALALLKNIKTDENGYIDEDSFPDSVKYKNPETGQFIPSAFNLQRWISLMQRGLMQLSEKMEDNKL